MNVKNKSPNLKHTYIFFSRHNRVKKYIKAITSQAVQKVLETALLVKESEVTFKMSDMWEIDSENKMYTTYK